MSYNLTSKFKTIKELGTLNGVLYLIGRTLNRLSRNAYLFKYYFYAQPVPDHPILPERLGRSIDVHQVERGDPVLEKFGRPMTVIENRFEQGASCLCATKNAELTGFIWLIMDDYEEDEVRCTFSPQPHGDVSWDFDIFVSSKDRLGITFAVLWNSANIWMKSRNIQWTTSRVSAFNLPSIRSHVKLNAIQVGSAVFLVFGKFQIAFFSSKPWLHISFSPNSRPSFSIQAPLS